MLSTIRLFKAVPVETKSQPAASLVAAVNTATLPYGFIFAPEVISSGTYSIDQVNSAYGRNPQELNQSFHKSFAKVRDASMRQLVFEQILHYFTTYGAETLGFYNQDSVYIPGEVLNAPELADGVRLIVIHGLTKKELKDKLMTLLSSGIALHEQTLADAMEVAQFVGFVAEDIAAVKNKEAKADLYNAFGLVPSDAEEFLRYIIYRATGSTLLIKDRKTIEAIRSSEMTTAIAWQFANYERDHGLEPLSAIFYRYKSLWLAFRTTPVLKRTINRIRRLAVQNHKPMREDYLNTVTARLRHGEKLEENQFDAALERANVFRKIRLAYALKFRTTGADSVLYRVRNGKSWATSFSFPNDRSAATTYQTVVASILEDIRPNVEGKKIFIPAGLKYGLPATEKQFTGNLPSGTFVEVARDMVVGVHWTNVAGGGPRGGESRIDLDLSVQNAGGKIGWDSRYRNDNRDVLWSGDMTDAPISRGGATEVFHIGSTARGSWLMNLNYYNYSEQIPVPFKILVSQAGRDEIRANYTVDPNEIIAMSNSLIDVRQKTLGIIVADGTSTKFYFSETGFGSGISARQTVAAEQARQYLFNYYTGAIVFNDVLAAAGAIMVDSNIDADLDLSPEAVDKTTFLGLLQAT